MKKLFVLLMLALFMAGCSEDTDFGGEIVMDIPTEATTAVAQGQEFSLGYSTGRTYRNEFIGIQCTLDENWTFMTDEEIQTQNETTLGLVGDNYAEAIKSASILYDMMATHSNQQDTVGVVLEKPNAATLLLSEEAYLNASKDDAVGSLESLGITVSSAEIVKIKFAGAEHYALKVAGRFTGYNVYECMVAIKCNGYVAVVTACTWDTNTTMDIISQFEAY